MAEKTTFPIEIDTKDIKELMEFYGFQDLMQYGTFKSCLLGILVESLVNKYKTQLDMRELLSLVKFLRLCHGGGEENPLILKRTITTSSKFDLKGQVKTITISNNYILTALELFAKRLLIEENDLWIQLQYANEKNCLDKYHSQSMNDSYDGNELNDDEIIDMMENYCSTIPQINVTNNSHLGRVASAILIMLDKWCICSNKPNKTKLYSFVYDLMRWAKFTGKTCITEEGFSGDIGREKCQQVRNWLKAWGIDSHATRKENVKITRNQVCDLFHTHEVLTRILQKLILYCDHPKTD